MIFDYLVKIYDRTYSVSTFEETCTMRGEQLVIMKKRAVLFRMAIVIAVVMILLGVYYLIPHIWHPFISLSDPFYFIKDPVANYNAHKKYTAIFFALALLALVWAFFLRSRKARYNH